MNWVIDGIQYIKSLHINFRLKIRKIKYSHNLTFIQYSRLKTIRHLSNVYYSNLLIFSDQNRNKTKTKNNQKSANQQADVISLQNKQEVTRLEALCETRTKELNYARLQMKSNLQAFDAMTVMVQYLSEDVGTTV